MGANLSELANKYGTDKGPALHNYTKIYEKIFERKKTTLLELGVYTGASIRMWIDYFPDSKIWGIDIAELPKIDGANLRKINAIDEVALSELCGEAGGFDIIIDDASHRPKDQIRSCEILFPLLNKNGIYVIEDIFTSRDERYGKRDGPEDIFWFLWQLTRAIHGQIHLSGFGGLTEIRTYKNIAFLFNGTD